MSLLCRQRDIHEAGGYFLIIHDRHTCCRADALPQQPQNVISWLSLCRILQGYDCSMFIVACATR
eukprot:scaffold261659_cov40-Prasinocladus_malaysianus.AAC.1